MGMMVSVFGFFMGFIIDNMGVKWSLVLGSMLLLCSRFVIAVTTSRKVMQLVLVSLYLPSV